MRLEARRPVHYGPVRSLNTDASEFLKPLSTSNQVKAGGLIEFLSLDCSLVDFADNTKGEDNNNKRNGRGEESLRGGSALSA